MTAQAATTSPTRLERERKAAVEAVAAASRLCRAVRADFAPAEATAKADRSPVTVADLGAQALISLRLADAFPDVGLMGEEDSAPLAGAPGLAEAVRARVAEHRAGVSLTEVRSALDRCDDPGGPARRWWTLDPVDGTKGFLRNEQYAVALALIEDGEVVLAVMGCPNLPHDGDPGSPGPSGSVFVAERGSGVRQLPLEGAEEDPGRPIHVADPPSLREARWAESVEAAHSSQSATSRIASALGITAPPVRLDSQAKYAVVARGDAAIYLRLPHGDYRENVWDHAAGALIVEEAGGRVSDALGRPLDFTAGRRLDRNHGIVVTTATIHEAVLQAVGQVVREP
ncbi:3'(2'),5'-bisphosphate nucleotidase [soil metagenome]